MVGSRYVNKTSDAVVKYFVGCDKRAECKLRCADAEILELL